MSKAHRTRRNQGSMPKTTVVSTRSSVYILRLPVGCFYGIPECANKQVSDFCASSWALFLLFILSNSNVLVFVLGHFIIISEKPVRVRKGMVLHSRGSGEELRGGERGEAVIRIYYCEKEIYVQWKGVKTVKVWRYPHPQTWSPRAGVYNVCLSHSPERILIWFSTTSWFHIYFLID